MSVSGGTGPWPPPSASAAAHPALSGDSSRTVTLVLRVQSLAFNGEIFLLEQFILLQFAHLIAAGIALGVQSTLQPLFERLCHV